MQDLNELRQRIEAYRKELRSIHKQNLKELNESLNAILTNALRKFRKDMDKSVSELLSELHSYQKSERWKYALVGLGIGIALGILIGLGASKKLQPKYWEVVQGRDGKTYIIPRR